MTDGCMSDKQERFEQVFQKFFLKCLGKNFPVVTLLAPNSPRSG